MSKQKIRGVLYFEDLEIGDIIIANKKSKGFDNINIVYFYFIEKEGEIIEKPGIFVDGEVSDKYTSEGFVSDIRKNMGLSEKKKNCDISIENEDIIEEIISSNNIEGDYVGIRILQPYTIPDIRKIAKKLGKICYAENVVIRTVEKNESEKWPRVCIDIISKYKIRDFREDIEELIGKNKLKIHSYTHAEIKGIDL